MAVLSDKVIMRSFVVEEAKLYRFAMISSQCQPYISLYGLLVQKNAEKKAS